MPDLHGDGAAPLYRAFQASCLEFKAQIDEDPTNKVMKPTYVDAMLVYAKGQGIDDLAAAEHIVGEAWEGRAAIPENALAPEFSEEALARVFTDRHKDDLKYVNLWLRWLVWDGHRWRMEETLRALDLARAICREAAIRCNGARGNKLASYATMHAVEMLARADRIHAAEPGIWDSNPWSLNTPAGSVDLKTAMIAPPRREDFNTKICTVAPGTDCPLWQAFLATITGGDVELQDYLQRLAGYCLTGVTVEHAMFFFYGTGANGKTVFINALSGVLGDYATIAPMEMLMATKGEHHPTDLAGLRGARLVTATETEQGRRWAEAKIKKLTGGEEITARFMRQDFFNFMPQFKLLLAGNHKPSILNVDEAMRRRLHLVPFAITIPPEKRDPALPEKLLAERDGILAWAIEGCLEWQRIGLRPPPVVTAATNEYFEAEDVVGRWLGEACERGPGLAAAPSALYGAFKAWAEASGEDSISSRWFAGRLTSLGFKMKRGTGGRRSYLGLRPRENQQELGLESTE